MSESNAAIMPAWRRGRLARFGLWLFRRGWGLTGSVLVGLASPMRPRDRSDLLIDPQDGDSCHEFTNGDSYTPCSGDGHYLCRDCGHFEFARGEE